MKYSSLEPQTKLVSGDQLPHAGPFSGWNFDPWNHHASHSNPKMDSTWDCRSSTQSFVCGSVLIVIVALLSACGGGARKIADETTVQNPYLKQSRMLSDVGIMAMQRERWDYAGSVFERALKEAQLADDSLLVAKQWYNLGTAHTAAKKYRQALHDFSQSQAVAKQADDSIGLMRARLAWMLLSVRTGDNLGNEKTWQPQLLAETYPADVHLAAARLAQQQKRLNVAKQEYGIVLKKGGMSRSGLLYRGQAHLGLAMIAREEKSPKHAKQAVEASLQLLRQAGSPRLIAHALLLYGKLELTSIDRRSALQRALVIYQRLEDARGQRDCLAVLQKINSHTVK